MFSFVVHLVTINSSSATTGRRGLRIRTELTQLRVIALTTTKSVVVVAWSSDQTGRFWNGANPVASFFSYFFSPTSLLETDRVNKTKIARAAEQALFAILDLAFQSPRIFRSSGFRHTRKKNKVH